MKVELLRSRKQKDNDNKYFKTELNSLIKLRYLKQEVE